MLAGVIKLLRAGQASSMPGKITNRLFPGYLHAHAARLVDGLAIISGTNGKTTTANMTALALHHAGRHVVHNAEGANLFSGIATAFAREPHAAFGLLEIDEAIVPLAVRRLRPPVAFVLTNLFRDQLDRYGEVDRLATGWQEMLRELPDTTVIANADDPLVAWVAQESGRPAIFFGVDGLIGGAGSEVSDVTVCPRCATMLQYTSRWLSQLGDYHCPGCGFARPKRDLWAAGDRLTTQAGGGVHVPLGGSVEATLTLRVPGLHTVYDALGALALSQRLDVPTDQALAALALYQPVFGRWSQVRRGQTVLQVNLAKNPAGMNQTLRTVGAVPGRKALVFILNDNIADGRDISWIWDIDMEDLLPEADAIITSGTRRHEMALRLKYAGVPPERLQTTPSLEAALELLRRQGHHSIYVLPTYTALKEVRRTLAGWEAVNQ